MNKLIFSSQYADFSSLTPTQLVGQAGQLIRLERLVHGEPVSVERVQHSGPGDGPIQASLISSKFEPTPELMAATLQILERFGGLDEEPTANKVEPEPRKDGSGDQ